MSVPFTSPLARDLAADVLERFGRYVRIDTQSSRDSADTPSTSGQLALARLLAAELTEAGLTDAAIDPCGIVTATLPGAPQAPLVGLLAHMDTSPDAPGAGVEPLVHRDYAGATLELPRNGTKLAPDRMPELLTKLGHDLVTSSGDTLLGADDKAGVAEIMAATAHLARHPELARCTVRVCFTPDEEIGGGGARALDLERFGARCAYTVDGSELGELQDESFSADEATLEITGVEVHPGQAKGKLVNALRLASQVITALPANTLTPETSSGREGFIHVHELAGNAAFVRLRAILRDFDEERLEAHGALLERTAREVVAREPRARLDFRLERQYRNMATALAAHPEIVACAEKAMREEGVTPLRSAIRGGTDGSLLTARGLPTPNLFTGGHEYHSLREWCSVQDMASAAATLVRLAGIWAVA